MSPSHHRRCRHCRVRIPRRVRRCRVCGAVNLKAVDYLTLAVLLACGAYAALRLL